MGDLVSLKKISGWLHQASKGWIALLSLVIFILFTVLVLPGQASKAQVESNSAGSPDLSFFYTPNDLNRMAEAYGEKGREAYIKARFTFDLIWPLVYTAFLTTGMSWLLRQAFEPASLWQRLNLLAPFAALCDYLENISTSLLMMQYPSRLPLIAILATIFTMAKWLLLAGSFSVLLIAVGTAIIKWVKRRVDRH